MHYLMYLTDWETPCSRTIDFLYAMAHSLHLSYGCVNVLIYAIMQPGAILMLLASALLALYRKRKASYVCLALGLVLVVVELAMVAFTVATVPDPAQVPHTWPH